MMIVLIQIREEKVITEIGHEMGSCHLVLRLLSRAAVIKSRCIFNISGLTLDILRYFSVKIACVTSLAKSQKRKIISYNNRHFSPS